MTLRSFACVSMLISATSSRSIDPPLASSKQPAFFNSAPVNAPFSCPKSSFSMTSFGIAAQLMVRYGSSCRGLWLWMSRATTSLPVPLSPVMRTVVRDFAMRLTADLISQIGGLWPTRTAPPPGEGCPYACCFGGMVWR
jgi:hypothetical protein